MCGTLPTPYLRLQTGFNHSDYNLDASRHHHKDHDHDDYHGHDQDDHHDHDHEHDHDQHVLVCAASFLSK